jgi:hypothetical protein
MQLNANIRFVVKNSLKAKKFMNYEQDRKITRIHEDFR